MRHLQRITASLVLVFLALPLEASAATSTLPRRVLRHLPPTAQTTVIRPVRKALGIPKVTADMTRGAFVASLMQALYPGMLDDCFVALSESRYTHLFPDVPRTSQYAAEICVAIEMGVVQGYPDGLFRPDQHINTAEAAKVIAKAYGIAKDSSDPNVPWYQPYVTALRALGISLVPSSLADPFPYERAKQAVLTVRCSRAILPSGPRRSSAEERGRARSGSGLIAPCP